MSTLFLTDNKGIDGATYAVTTGTENAQFPLTNLNDDHTTKVFRSVGNTCEITVDMLALSTVDTFALVGSGVDGLSLTACSVYLSATNNFAGAPENVVEINNEYGFGYARFTAASYRYLKISLTGNGSYCEFSNFYIGSAATFANNGIDRSSFVFSTKDISRITKNKYGQRFIDKYNKIRLMTGVIKAMNSTEFTTLQNIYKDHGTSKPIWFMADSDEATVTDADFIFSGYFYLLGKNVFTTTSGLLYDSQFSLEEAV